MNTDIVDPRRAGPGSYAIPPEEPSRWEKAGNIFRSAAAPVGGVIGAAVGGIGGAAGGPAGAWSGAVAGAQRGYAIGRGIGLVGSEVAASGERVTNALKRSRDIYDNVDLVDPDDAYRYARDYVPGMLSNYGMYGGYGGLYGGYDPYGSGLYGGYDPYSYGSGLYGGLYGGYDPYMYGGGYDPYAYMDIGMYDEID